MASHVIDERVVQMRFENSDFEKNVATSRATLAGLKEDLKLQDAAKGFHGISDAAKSISFAGISTGVKGVRAEFSALQVYAITTLTDISRKINSVAKNLFADFTTTPIKTGMAEYEEKMGSVQTIMMSTGESLQTVMKYLEELNTYSDKTIYSFKDMTSNIGKFTNAGVKLDTAVKAIQGVSNLAAVSGAGAAEASRAMYNFSQALSSGYVKLIDWKSIENANMATVEFKNNLLEAGVKAGTLEKAADGMYRVLNSNAKNPMYISATKEFNDSLQKGWMTTEVLTKTLGAYADETTEIGKKAFAAAQDVKTFSMMMDTLKEAAQSGWAQSLEIIIGDFGQAKELFTSLSNFFGDIIDRSAKARNALLKGALGGKSQESFEKLSKGIESAGINMDDFSKKAFEAGKAAGKFDKSIQTYDDFTKKYGSFQNSLKSGWFTKDIYLETLEGFEKTGSSVEKVTVSLEKLKEVANDVIRGDFGNGEKRVKELTKAGYDYATVQSIVNNKLLGTKIDLSKLNAEQMKAAGCTKEQIEALQKLQDEAKKSGASFDEMMSNLAQKSGRDLLIESMWNTIHNISQYTNLFKSAFSDIFPPMTSEVLYNIIYNFNILTQKMSLSQGVFDDLKDTLKGVFSLVDLTGYALKATAKELVKTFGGDTKNLSRNIVKLSGNWGRWTTNMVKSVKETKSFEKVLASTSKVFKNTLGSVKEFTTSHELIPKSVHIAGEALSWLCDRFKEVYDWMKEVAALPSVQNLCHNILNALSGLASSGVGYLHMLGDVVSDVVQNLGSLDEIRLVNVVDALNELKSGFFGVGKAASSDAVRSATRTLEGIELAEGPIRDLAGGANTLADVFEKVKVKFDEIYDGFDAETATAILGGAQMILVTKSITGVLNSFSGLLSSMANPFQSFASFVGSFSKLVKAYVFNLKAKAVLTLALALGAVAASLWVLAQIPANDLERVVKVVAGIGMALAGLTIAISYFASAQAAVASSGIKGGGVMLLSTIFSMISAAVAMLVMVKVLKELNEVIDTLKPSSYVALVGIMGLLTACITIANLTGKEANDNTLGLNILGMAASLYLIVRAMEKFQDLDGPKLMKNLKAMAVVLTTFVGLFALATFSKGGGSWKAGLSMLSLAIALTIMAVALEKFAKTPTDQIRKGVANIKIFLKEFLILMAFSSVVGKNAGGFGGMMVGVMLAMLLFIEVADRLAKSPKEAIEDAKKLLYSITGCIAAILACSRLAGSVDMKSIIALIALLGGLVIAISYLSGISWKKTIPAATAMGIVLVALGMMVKGLSVFAFESTGIVSTVSIIGSMLALVIAVAKSLGELAQNDWKANLSAAGALALALGALGGVMAALVAVTGYVDKAGISKMAILKMEGLLAVMGVIAGGVGLIIAELSKISDPSAYVPTAVSIGTLLLAMTVSMGGLALIGKIAPLPTLLMGMAAMAIFIAGLAALSYGFGKLTAQRGTIRKGLSVMEMLMSGLGRIIGSFFGGIKAGWDDAQLKGLTRLLDNFEGLKEKIDGFTDSTKGVNNLKDVLKSIKDISTMRINTSTVESLCDVTKTIGEAFGSFCVKLKSVPDDSVEKAKIAAESLEAIATVAKNIPNTGGKLAELLGDNRLDVFTNMFPALASGLKDMSANLADYSEDDKAKIKLACETLDVLTTSASAVQNQGGLLAYVMGDNDIATFASGLGEFAQGLNAAAYLLSDFSEEKKQKIQLACETLDVLTTAGNGISNTGGLLGFLMGNNDFKTFGMSLESLGTALGNLSGDIESINLQQISTLASVISYSLVPMMSAVSSTKVDGVFAFVQAFQKLGELKLQNGDNTATFMQMGMNMVNGLAAGITGAGANVSKAWDTVLKGMSDEIQSFIDEMDTKGEYVDSNLATGITNAGRSVANALKNVVTKACSGATSKDITDKMVSTGQNIARGLINGMKSKLSDAYDAGYALGDKAARGAKAGADVNSPSKKTIPVGKSVGEGLIVGMSAMVKSVVNTGYALGDKAATSMTSVVTRVADTLNAGMDMSPVITPVVDMTNVDSSVSRMNGLFGSPTSTFGLATSIKTETVQNAGRVMSTSDTIVRELLQTSRETLNAIREGADIYLNEDLIIGRVNRKLGMA